MTKLEELEELEAAYAAACVAARTACDVRDTAYDACAAWVAADAYRDELKKTQEENTDD